MPVPPHRSLPPDPQQIYQQAAATASPSVRRSLGSYFSLSLWRTLFQQAARHRYWMKGAAIAYGAACAGLLGLLALLALATLKTDLQASLLAGLSLLFPAWSTAVSELLQEMASEWSLSHRWLTLILSSLLGLGIWLKVIGLAQQIIRSDGDLASHLVPTLRHRLTTVLVAVACASLTLLAMVFVLMTLPQAGADAIANNTLLGMGRKFFMQGLRWCFTLSTIALTFGLLYRSSQKSSAKAMPILPGTVFATLLWLVTSIVLKLHLGSLANQHWLWLVVSTVTISLLALYVCTLGLLLGGQYNKLISRYFPRSPHQTATPHTPPPSFESFTIQKRPYR